MKFHKWCLDFVHITELNISPICPSVRNCDYFNSNCTNEFPLICSYELVLKIIFQILY